MRFVCLLSIIFLLSGCGIGVDIDRASPVAESPTPLLEPGTWHDIAPGVARAEFAFAKPESARLVLYRFEPNAFTWRFEHSQKPKLISSWAEAFPEAAFLINGVYFHEDFLPSGFLSANGERIGTRAFDQSRSGLIVLSPTPAILDTPNQHVRLDAFGEAAQSFPFLIKNGRPALEAPTENLAVRSLIGIDEDGKMYLGVARGMAVSLFALMEALQKTGVPWRHVLNLDGGASTGFAADFGDWQEQMDNLTPVPNILLLTRE